VRVQSRCAHCHYNHSTNTQKVVAMRLKCPCYHGRVGTTRPPGRAPQARLRHELTPFRVRPAQVAPLLQYLPIRGSSMFRFTVALLAVLSVLAAWHVPFEQVSEAQRLPGGGQFPGGGRLPGGGRMPGGPGGGGMPAQGSEGDSYSL